MRPSVEAMLRGRKFPLIMAHKGGTVYGRENSLVAVRGALAHMPDVIIEVDVHKSRDNVLYCHHGSIPFGVIAAAFLGLFTFKQIQKLVGQRDTLEQVLAAIPNQNIVYLDIKDLSITADDLKPLISDRPHIWIGPLTTLKHLKELRKGLGETFAYAYNRPVLFPRRMLRKIKGHSDFLQTFWWNWNRVVISEIETSGVFSHLTEWFISRHKYIAFMQQSQYRGLFFSINDLADAKKAPQIDVPFPQDS